MGCFGFGVTSRGGLNRGNREEKLGFEESFEKMAEKIYGTRLLKRRDSTEASLVWFSITENGS